MGLFDVFKKRPAASDVPARVPATIGEGVVCAPASGTVEQMESLPDAVFASGCMGHVLGTWPKEGAVYAPVDGKVSVAMPHAIGIGGAGAAAGLEVLLHVGVDTVEMAGDGFDLRVSVGQEVKAGELLLTFDRDRVAKAGHPDIVMTIVTNSAEIEEAGASIADEAAGEVTAGSVLMRVSG